MRQQHPDRERIPSVQGERIVLAFLITLNLAAYAFSATSGLYLGDAVGLRVTLDPPALLAVSAAVIGAYLLIYIYVTRLTLRPGGGDPAAALGVIEGVLILGVVLAWIGFLTTGYGAAETRSSRAFGFLFKLLPYDLAFALYLCAVRSVKRGLCVCAPYALLRLLMGWTGFLFVSFCILFIRWFNARRRRPGAHVMGIGLFCMAFLLSPFVLAIKFLVRYGEMPPFGYALGIAQLTGRLTSIGNSAFAVQNAELFASRIEMLSFPWVAVLDPLLGMVPRALLGFHFENYETVYVQIVHGALNPGVIFFLGLIGKLHVCFAQSTWLGLAVVAMAALLLALIVCAARWLLGSAAMPYVLLAGLGFISTGSLEELGAQLYGLLFLCAVVMVRNAYAGAFTARTAS